MKMLFLCGTALALSACGDQSVNQAPVETVDLYDWRQECLQTPMLCVGDVYASCGKTYVITASTLDEHLGRMKHSNTNSAICRIVSVMKHDPESEAWISAAIESIELH